MDMLPTELSLTPANDIILQSRMSKCLEEILTYRKKSRIWYVFDEDRAT